MHATALALALLLPLVHGSGASGPTAAPRAQEEEPKPGPAVHPALRALGTAAESTMLFRGSTDVALPKRLERMFNRQMDARFRSILGLPGFKGELWVWRSARGETLMLSKQRAPGFVIYRDGAIYLTQVVHLDGAPMDLELVEEDLWRLASLDQLFRDVCKGEFESLGGADADVASYRAEVPDRARLDGAVQGQRKLTVLARGVEIDLDPASNAIRSVSLSVEREPNIQFGGNNVDEDDGKGVTHRVTLDAVTIGDKLPERVAKALAEMREMADEVEAR